MLPKFKADKMRTLLPIYAIDFNNVFRWKCRIIYVSPLLYINLHLLIEFERLPSYSNTKKEIFPKIIIDVHLMRVIAKIIFDPYVGP